MDDDELNPNDLGVEEVSLPSDLDIRDVENMSKEDRPKSEEEDIDVNQNFLQEL